MSVGKSGRLQRGGWHTRDYIILGLGRVGERATNTACGVWQPMEGKINERKDRYKTLMAEEVIKKRGKGRFTTTAFTHQKNCKP